MKYYPGGSYLVMNSMTIVLGYRLLMAIGYNHNSQKIPGSIATEGYGSTVPGEPYLYPLSDNFSNVSVFPGVYSYILGSYFNAYKAIHQNGQIPKYNIALEL